MGLDSHRDLGLPEFLALRARYASDRRLALDAAGGLFGVAASALLRPPGWVVLSAAGLCFVAFGGWGIADRELSERRATIGRVGACLLLVGRAIAAALGALAGVLLIFAAVAFTLGAWIS